MKNIDCNNLVLKLRLRLAEYRIYKKDSIVSTHVNTVEIAVNLVDFGLKEKRVVTKEEEMWFKGSYYVQLVFEDSEWEDISTMYEQLINQAKEAMYFR